MIKLDKKLDKWIVIVHLMMLITCGTLFIYGGTGKPEFLYKEFVLTWMFPLLLIYHTICIYRYIKAPASIVINLQARSIELDDGSSIAVGEKSKVYLQKTKRNFYAIDMDDFKVKAFYKLPDLNLHAIDDVAWIKVFNVTN